MTHKAYMTLGMFAGAIVVMAISTLYGLSGRPAFCGACHSMNDIYVQWSMSRHKQFACIECHLPAAGQLTKIAYKTRAGIRDLYNETNRQYSAHPVMSLEGREIANGNCLRCHYSTVESTTLVRGDNCLRCHRGLVHTRNQSKGGVNIEKNK